MTMPEPSQPPAPSESAAVHQFVASGQAVLELTDTPIVERPEPPE